MYCEDGADDLESLQQALNQERRIYNYDFPSRAGNCNGRPPVVAYPKLLSPTRPYQANQELAVFDMRRVHEYLATFSFVRKVNTSGQVSLGRQMYSIGRRHAGITVEVRFCSQIKQWLFFNKREEEKTSAQELARRQPKKLNFESLSGLKEADFQPCSPIQLNFPAFL